MKQCKRKPCKVCRKDFQPRNSLQRTCDYKCAQIAVQEANAKKAARVSKEAERAGKRDRAARKVALKSKSDWLREAQTACNAFIRERDKDLPCISCGNTRDVKYCAGHYKTRGGHPELRFHPFNINKQCDWNCNLNLSGNIANYRPALAEKIGIPNLEWLEGKHEAQNLTIDDIQEIKIYYREQLKLLINRGE